MKQLSFKAELLAGAANGKLGLRIAQSPDDQTMATHTSVANATFSPPRSPINSAARAGVIGEFVYAIVRVGGTATTGCVVNEVYEMRDPY